MNLYVEVKRRPRIMRLERRFWAYIGRRVTPYVPARYGVQIHDTCTWVDGKNGPGIVVQEDRVTVKR